MSDILIKNMELPKEGGLVIEITKHGQVAQLFKDGSLLRKGVKAIELPPHGELIERDRAIDEMEYVSFDTAHNCELAQEVLRYNVPVFLEAST